MTDKLGQYIAGGKSRSGLDRQEHDFYITPKESVEALLNHKVFNNLHEDMKSLTMWENAVGNGGILNPILRRSYKIVGTDLNNWIDRFTQNDFLANPTWFFDEYGHKPDIIITNPPYKDANEWILNSIEHTGRFIILFLRLSFLESVSRYKIFKMYPHLKYILVFSKRQSPIHWSLVQKGEELKSSSTTPTAWFIWDIEYNGLPTIDWILDGNQNTLDDW